MKYSAVDSKISPTLINSGWGIVHFILLPASVLGQIQVALLISLQNLLVHQPADGRSGVIVQLLKLKRK